MINHELLNESNEELDRSFMVSFSSPTNQVSVFSKNLNMTLHCNIVFSDSEATLIFRIPQSLCGRKEAIMLIKEFNGVEDSGITTISLDVSETPPTKFIKSILSVPSVVLDRIFLKNGRFYVSARFSYLDSRSASRLLLNASNKLESFSIEYYGEGVSNIEAFKRIDEDEKHSYVEIVTAIDKKEESLPGNTQWYCQLKALSHKGLRWHSIGGSSEEYCEGNETKPVDKVLDFLVSECLRRSIMVSSVVNNYDAQTLKTGIFLPTVYVSKFVKVLSEINEKVGDVEYSFRLAIPVSEI